MSEHTPLTVGEFERTMTALRDEIRLGFARINGRLDRHGNAIAEHGQQLARHDARLDSAESRPAAAPLSKATIGIITGVLSAYVTILLGMAKAFGWIN